MVFGTSSEVVLVALAALRANKLRSLLTMLGIVIGVAAVIAMLYGIRPREQRALRDRGVRVRVLISYGTHWFPWYVRRLAERPANLWFVARSIVS